MVIVPFLYALLVVALVHACSFIAGHIVKNFRISDFAWLVSIIMVLYFTLFEYDRYYIRTIETTIIVTIWFILSLSRIIMLNKIREESRAYVEYKRDNPRFFMRSIISFFLIPLFLSFLISLPIICINSFSESGLTHLDSIGLFFWFCGFGCSLLGDSKLLRFIRKKERGYKILKNEFRLQGHEFYYGEVLQWLGIFIIGLSVPYGFLGILSLLTIVVVCYFNVGMYKPLRLFRF